MRFGKIDYLNLLPFDVFIKGFAMCNASKKMISHRKSYPARLNADFKARRIDCGFISSIAGRSCHYKRKACASGIIARGAVWSVLVKADSENLDDYQSASSNALAKILGIKGEVLIGDRALKFKLQGGKHIDLGQEWLNRHGLPFVFGRLCYQKNDELARLISKVFNRKFGANGVRGIAARRKKIAHYILQNAAHRTGITARDISQYLEHIFYAIGAKELRALEVFYRSARILRLR